MIQWMGNLCWDKLSSSAGLNCLSLKWLQSAGGSAGAHGLGGNSKHHQCGNPKLLLPGSLPCGLLAGLDSHILFKDNQCTLRKQILMYNHLCA